MARPGFDDSTTDGGNSGSNVPTGDNIGVHHNEMPPGSIQHR